MKVKCSNCGETISVNGLGRRPLEIGVNNVYDALRLHSSVAVAANELGCSRAYIYKELAKYGTTPRDVTNGCWKPRRKPLRVKGDKAKNC